MGRPPMILLHVTGSAFHGHIEHENWSRVFGSAAPLQLESFYFLLLEGTSTSSLGVLLDG